MKYPQSLTNNIMLLGNHCFSIYLIRGRGSHTLIESGISSTAEQIISQIRSFDIDTSRIHNLILTHAHADHITGAPFLKRIMPWLRVKTGPETERLLAKESVRKIFLREDREIRTRLAALGAVENSHIDEPSLENMIDETIRPGQILKLEGNPLEVLDAPGHCKGGIALWQPENKVLFCSDYLGFYLPPDRFVPNFYVDYDDFSETFKYLSELKPAWICPGHCGAYAGEDAIRFIDKSRAEVKWVYDYVVNNCQSPEEIEKAKEFLFDRYYVGEATMFSARNTRYCMELLIRRILSSKAMAQS